MNKTNRMRALIVGMCLMFTLSAATSASASTGTRRQMFLATNDSRTAHSVPALTLNDRLLRLAHRHSVAMARAGTLFHTQNVQIYLSRVHWHVWGENVGVTSGSVAGLERMFMRSPEHRRNILDRSFTHVAVGIYDHGGRLWVTVFFYG